MLFFFFQAEDGIRDLTVTGVQTCALPISRRSGSSCGRSTGQASARSSSTMTQRLTAVAQADPTAPNAGAPKWPKRSEEHTSELQSQSNLVCRLLLEKKKNKKTKNNDIQTE